MTNCEVIDLKCEIKLIRKRQRPRKGEKERTIVIYIFTYLKNKLREKKL